VCRAEADDLLNALAGAFASLRERAMGNEIDWMFEGAQVAGDPFDDMVL